MQLEHIKNERAERLLLVTSETGRKPQTVDLLNQWHYLEVALMRLVAAWGVPLREWDDKAAAHRFVWEQAESVHKLRARLAEFPGTEGNLDRPVSFRLERLANTVLEAPAFEDALDGISVLANALTKAYLSYAESAHPVHDAPTLAVLREVAGLKEDRRLWQRDYRRRNPHVADQTFLAAIERELEACARLGAVLPLEDGQRAGLVGVRSGFEMLGYASNPWTTPTDLMPYLQADFEESIETRRLFWAYGYMLEFSLGEEMLRWVWAAHFMPWAYQEKLARHLWDESRHGESGRSRLLDFGLTREDFGFASFSQISLAKVPTMTPAQLLEQAFFIGMVAETGHFTVKNEAYADFKAGGDLESAEMVLFDVIDEGAHVAYCHEWLPELARRAGEELGDYRQRAAARREEMQTARDQRTLARREERRKERREERREENDPTFALYQKMLKILREQHPLSNAASCPPRTRLPM